MTDCIRADVRDIEARLRQHPHVNEAVVLAPEDEPGGAQLVAYVVADLAKLKALNRADSRYAQTGIIARWNRLYELTYSAGPAAPSFVGWNSSYTRQPIPEDQMREWLQTTLQRIQALKPWKVCEVGCGVGLLLQHLAPRCAEYVGTDFSASALAQLARWLRQQGDLQHVELLHRSATELQDLASGRFDTIVLNSVVQYFPDVEYLLAVLQEAVRLLAPGGKIFIGDVRNLCLLSMFHSAVQLSRAADSVNVGELRRRISRAVAQETELAIDPQFFEILPQCELGISAVDVQLRRGRAPNELTRYRYDVVLHRGEQREDHAIHEPLDWKEALGTDAGMATALSERRWRALRLSSVENLRLARDEAARRLIQASHERVTAGELRDTLNELELHGVDPETFWEWGREYDYDVSVRWGRAESPECFDVQLLDRSRADQVPRAPAPAGVAKPWSAYANDPLVNSIGQRFILQLREYLGRELPECSVPSSWMVLKQLPLGPDGKVNPHAL